MPIYAADRAAIRGRETFRQRTGRAPWISHRKMGSAGAGSSVDALIRHGGAMRAQVAGERTRVQASRAGLRGTPGTGALTGAWGGSAAPAAAGGGGGAAPAAAGGGGGAAPTGRWGRGMGRVRGAISSNILRAGQYAGSKAGNMGPMIRGAAWGAAKTPLRSAGIAGAAMYGAGRVAFGGGTVSGTAGYGIAGGMIGAAGGAAWANRLNAYKSIGGVGVARGSVASNTGRMARKMGARGAAAGLLIGALLSGNSAPNSFRGLHR